MKKPKIKDCLPLVNGIWGHINYEFPEIFDIDSSQLDIVFLSNWSMRTAAPILNVIHSDETTTMLNNEELTLLADVINGMYKHKWDKLMDVAEMEYDPIHNFSDHLIESVEYSEDESGSKSGSTSNSNTRTDNLTTTQTDRRGYTDTFNNSDTRTDNLTEGHSYNSKNTKDQKEDGYTDQDTSKLAYSEQAAGSPAYTDQVTDGHTQQDPNALGFTQQDENYKAYTEQDASHKKTTEELIVGFNSSDYSGANKEITDSGKVFTSQGKVNNSVGTVNTSQGRIESSQGKINTSVGKVLNSVGRIEDAHSGNDTITNTGTETTAHSGTVGRVNSGTLTEQDTGTQTNSGSGTSSETSSNGRDGERSREYTKTGNIGNISTQKLLNEEIDLWKYNFILEMMRDVINFISLPIYEQ